MNIKIAIIGNINTGKSTLFNKITKNDYKSIVNEIPAFTRDRKYGDFIINKNKFIEIIDNGSFIKINNKKIYKQIYNQNILSIKESNIILFIVDNILGFTIEDKFLYRIIKINSINKIVFLLVNKIDKDNNLFKFNKFNINYIHYISAKYNIGIKKLIIDILKNSNFVKINKNIDIFKKKKEKNIKMIVLGKFNVGKSTFINKFINLNRLIVSENPKTTVENIEVLNKKKNILYSITDTYGINDINNNKYIIKKHIYNNLNKYNIIIFIFDINDDLSKKEMSFIRILFNLGKIVIILFNKIDLINKNRIILKKDSIKKKINFKNNKFFFLSLINKKHKLNYIFNYILNIYNNKNNKFKINYINSILKESIKNYYPYNKKKNVPKFKYSNLYKKRDYLILKIYVNNISYVHNSYKNYLINFFTEKLKLFNTYIKLILKNYK